MGFLVFILWLILAFVVAAGKKNKGRAYGVFLAMSIIFSPLIRGLILLMLGENKNAVEKQSIEDGDSKKCPYCAETIKQDADAFFESIGMDTTTAIRIFLKQTLIQHKIPFEIIQDNSFYSDKNMNALEHSKKQMEMNSILYMNS